MKVHLTVYYQCWPHQTPKQRKKQHIKFWKPLAKWVSTTWFLYFRPPFSSLYLVPQPFTLTFWFWGTKLPPLIAPLHSPSPPFILCPVYLASSLKFRGMKPTALMCLAGQQKLYRIALKKCWRRKRRRSCMTFLIIPYLEKSSLNSK